MGTRAISLPSESTIRKRAQAIEVLNAVNTQPQSKEGGRGDGEHAKWEQAGPNVRDPEQQLTIQTVVNLQFLELHVSSLFDNSKIFQNF